MSLKPADSSVVIPVFNQLRYTTDCLESLRRDGVRDEAVVVVDNASSDGTREFLASNPAIRTIHNDTNLGCAAAWNQGVEAATADWIIILNNDVLVAPGWNNALIQFATAQGLDIVSPGMCEQELDYNFQEFATQYTAKMSNVARIGTACGVCFMVHRRVFDKIGLFDPKLGIGGYEDSDFYRRAAVAGFRLGITGAAFLHHYGSVTQKSIKAERALGDGPLGNRDYYRQKHQLGWLKRRAEKVQDTVRSYYWRTSERMRYGLTLHMERSGGTWHYR